MKKTISLSCWSDNTENNIDLNILCNNCGKPGHQYHQCKMPITSIGIIVFRMNPLNNKREYLMIRRKDTLGYMDFMRGKFPIYQKKYIMNMLNQMTIEEKNRLRVRVMDASSNLLFKEKIHTLIQGVYFQHTRYDLLSLLEESDQTSHWTEPEWGFPKGRRNQQEKDYDCALREFMEETGYSTTFLKNIRNIVPFEEIFIGSNYKSYRHKYYLMNMSFLDSLSLAEKSFQKSEVSGMEWKTFEDCISCIRSYNIEKKQVLTNIEVCLQKAGVFIVGEYVFDPEHS
jgi:ADP-ribose pyrophosphatase YjhB (NUDIX family)